MNVDLPSQGASDRRRIPSFHNVAIVILAVIALVATFLIGTSTIEDPMKTRLFSGIMAAFLAISLSLHIWRGRRKRAGPVLSAVEDKLDVLDEAREYFAGSLKTADTFRFVADRLKELIPFDGLTLLSFDGCGKDPSVVAVQGSVIGGVHSSIVRDCVKTQEIQLSTSGKLAIAVPFIRDDRVVAVLRFDLPANVDAADISIPLLESIASRVGPLILSSLAFERSHAKALTDSVTDLPNERAFYQVIETQIAESQRHADGRPLSILAIDIKSFEEINQRFGHAAGDRVIAYVTQMLRNNLRQMDFLARSSGDEFLIVAPTATAEIAEEIIGRLQTTLFGRKLAITGSDSIELALNFGAASLGPDGETSEALLKAARLKKEQSKSHFPGNVLWFPQEYAN